MNSIYYDIETESYSDSDSDMIFNNSTCESTADTEIINYDDDNFGSSFDESI